MAIVARICEGTSYGIIGSTTYGVSSQELPPEEFDKYARSNSTAGGVGCALALVLGSFLFTFGGYMMPYFILGSIFLLLAMIVYFSGVFDEEPSQDIENLESYLEVREASCEIDYSSINKAHEPTFLVDHKFAFSLKVSIQQVTCTIDCKIWMSVDCDLQPLSNVFRSYYGIETVRIRDYG